MTVVLIPIRHLLQKMFHVVNESVLPLIEEDARSGVQRLQVHQAVTNAALAHDFVDSLGDVEQLHSLTGDPVHDPTEYLVTPGGTSLRRSRFHFKYLNF